MTGRTGAARRVVALALVAVVVAVAVGCTDGSDQDEGAITVFSQLTGAEAEAFEAVLADFTDRTGIAVRSVGTTNFELDLVDRLQTNDPPDVALVPQPGLIDAIVQETGSIVPLPADVVELVEANYDPVWRDLLAVDGDDVGLFAQGSAKSLVWYSPDRFAEAGYEVPTTLDELAQLLVRMVDDGARPWCVGLRDGTASGWVATDWVEDFVLRLEGTEVYDDWVAGEIPFTDERIQGVIQLTGIAGLRNATTSGPLRLIVSTPVQDAILGLLGEQPRCLLHRQASFAQAWLPAGTTVAPDGDLDVFVLPDIDGGPAPMLVGAQVAVAFRDDPDVWALMRHLADPALGPAVWAQYPGYLAPQRTFPLDGYADDFDRRVAELVRDAEVRRFDGSDLMPPRVGVKAFWDEMVAWVGGQPLAIALLRIQDAWSATEDDVSVEQYVAAVTEDEVADDPGDLDVPDTAPEQDEDVDDGITTTSTGPPSSTTVAPSTSTTATTSPTSTTSSTAVEPEPDAEPDGG